jgi:hypothetical protein
VRLEGTMAIEDETQILHPGPNLYLRPSHCLTFSYEFCKPSSKKPVIIGIVTLDLDLKRNKFLNLTISPIIIIDSVQNERRKSRCIKISIV